MERSKLKVGTEYLACDHKGWRDFDFSHRRVRVVDTQRYGRGYREGHSGEFMPMRYGMYLKVQDVDTGKETYVKPADIRGEWATAKAAAEAHQKAKRDAQVAAANRREAAERAANEAVAAAAQAGLKLTASREWAPGGGAAYRLTTTPEDVAAWLAGKNTQVPS